MSNTKLTTALAVVLALTAPAAFAQTSPPASPQATPQTSAPRTNIATATINPDQIRASKFIGSTVYDVQNRNIGSVKDVIMNRDGQVAAVVVDVGSFLGMGGKYVAINLADIKTDNNRLTLDRSKEQLQQAQSFVLENTNTGAGQGPSPTTGGRLGQSR